MCNKQSFTDLACKRFHESKSAKNLVESSENLPRTIHEDSENLQRRILHSGVGTRGSFTEEKRREEGVFIWFQGVPGVLFLPLLPRKNTLQNRRFCERLDRV